MDIVTRFVTGYITHVWFIIDLLNFVKLTGENLQHSR